MRGTHIGDVATAVLRGHRLLLLAAWLLFPLLLTAQPSGDYRWCVLYQGEDSLVYQFQVDHYTLDTLADTYWGKTLISPRISDAYEELTAGAPALPWITLPVDGVGENPRVHLLEADFQTIARGTLRPSYGSISANARRDTLTFRYGPAYASQRPFPQSPVALGPSFNFRGTQSLPLRLCPFRFVGRRGELLLSRTTTLALAWDHPQRPPNTSEPKQHDYIRSPLPKEPKMLVVLPEEFKDVVAEYLHFKRMQGLRVEVVSFGPKDGTLPVRDTTTLKSTIIASYTTDPQLRYILLLGDFAKIPSLHRASYRGHSESDVAYGWLVGADAISDAYVGRLPARNKEELTMMLQRIMHYEAQMRPTDTWPLASLAVASADFAAGYGNRTDAQHGQYLLDLLKQGGFPAGRLLTPRKYQNKLKADSVINDVEAGRGILFYAGHGVQNAWLTSDITTEMVQKLHNVNRCPIILAAACDNGIPNPSPSFAEAWLQVPNGGGALGFTGASDEIYWNEPMCAQEAMAKRLVMSRQWQRSLSMGELFFESTKAMMLKFPGVYARATANVWNLFGDPSLRVQTDKLTTFTGKYMATVEPSEHYYVVQGVPDSTCVTLCVHRPDKSTAYASAWSRYGVACIQLPPHTEDDLLELQAYHANAVPWRMENIPVRGRALQRIEFAAPQIQRIQRDDHGVPLAEPLVKLQVDYWNAGVQALPAGTQLQAWLLEKGGYPLTSSPIVLPELAAGATAADKLEFTFPASVAVSLQGRLTLELLATDAQHVLGWLKVPIIVPQNDFFLASTKLLSDGNPDGILQTGKATPLSLQLRYHGLLPQAIDKAELTIEGEPTLTIPHEALGKPYTPNELRTLGVNLTLTASHPNGMLLACALHLWPEHGIEEVHSFLLPYGMPYDGLENITSSYPFATQEGLLSCRFEVPGHAFTDQEGKLRAIRLDVWNPTSAPMDLGTVWTQVRELSRNRAEEDIYFSLEQLGKGQPLTLQPGLNHVELDVAPLLVLSVRTYELTIYSQRKLPNPRYVVSQLPSDNAPIKAAYDAAKPHAEIRYLDYSPQFSYEVEAPFEVELVTQGAAGIEADSLTVLYNGRLEPLDAHGTATITVYSGIQRLHIRSNFYCDTVLYLTMSPSQLRYTIDLRLPAPTQQLIQLFGSNGRPVPYARLQLDGAAEFCANAQGEAILELPNGQHDIKITALGYRDLHAALRITKQLEGPVAYTLVQFPDEPSVHCYPQPAEEYTYIQSHAAFSQVALYSLQGGLIALSDYPLGYGCQLSTATLPTGLYILQLRRGGHPVASTKLMVLKSKRL